jgi:hypothetical protein
METLQSFLGGGSTAEVDDEHLPCFHNTAALDGAPALSPAECVDVFNMCLQRHIIQPLAAAIDREAASVADLSARLDAAIDGSAAELEDNRSRLSRLADIIAACQSSMGAAFPNVSTTDVPDSIAQTGGPGCVAPSAGETSFAHHPAQNIHSHQQIQQRKLNYQKGGIQNPNLQQRPEYPRQHQNQTRATQRQNYPGTRAGNMDSQDKAVIDLSEGHLPDFDRETGRGEAVRSECGVPGTQSEEDNDVRPDSGANAMVTPGSDVNSMVAGPTRGSTAYEDGELDEESQMLIRAVDTAEVQAAQATITTRRGFSTTNRLKTSSKDNAAGRAEKLTAHRSEKPTASSPATKSPLSNSPGGNRSFFGATGGSSVKSGTDTNGSRASR